jgi:hypothetical protein
MKRYICPAMWEVARSFHVLLQLTSLHEPQKFLYEVSQNPDLLGSYEGFIIYYDSLNHWIKLINSNLQALSPLWRLRMRFKDPLRQCWSFL